MKTHFWEPVLEENDARLAINHCGGENEIWNFIDSGDFTAPEIFEILSGNEDGKTDHTGQTLTTCGKLTMNSVYVNGQKYSSAENFVADDFSLMMSLAMQGGAKKDRFKIKIWRIFLNPNTVGIWK